MSKQIKFGLALTLQILVILAIVLFKVSILRGGTEIVLKIAPVDPRDYLRGDYVVFQYSDISLIQSHMFSYQQIKKGDKVYVPLRRGDKFWYPAYGINKVKLDDGRVYLKGTVVGGSVEQALPPDIFEQNRFGRRGRSGNNVRIQYGIEEYFIPEGAGSGFNFGGKESYAKISVDNNGNAVLKQIYINDKPWP